LQYFIENHVLCQLAHILPKLQKSHPQDFKIIVDRLNVVALKKKHEIPYGALHAFITYSFRDIPDSQSARLFIYLGIVAKLP
jgi:hypothetical protein